MARYVKLYSSSSDFYDLLLLSILLLLEPVEGDDDDDDGTNAFFLLFRLHLQSFHMPKTMVNNVPNTQLSREILTGRAFTTQCRGPLFQVL